MTTTGTPFTGGSSDHVKSLTVEKELVINGKLSLARDWALYTPTFTNFTLAVSATRRAKFRVVGRTLHCSMEFLQTAAGTHTDGTYSISLPTGCLAIAPLGAKVIGSAYVIGTNSTGPTTLAFVGAVLLLTTSTVYVQYMSGPTTTVNSIVWGPTASNAAALRASTDTSLNVSLDFQVELDPASPILAASSQ